MTLTEKGYRKRLIDEKIMQYMRLFGAVSIEGPKWCGKTWTALNHVKSVVYMMDPEGDYANREAARLNPAAILTGNKPLLVDEWQEVPAIWDAVRFAADRTKDKGIFVLTGSSTPKDKAPMHSGAGRIGKIRMRTMSLYESGESSGLVSLTELFAGKSVETGMSKIKQDSLIGLLIRGGWPENINSASTDAGIVPEQYIEAIINSDITYVDNINRNPELASHLLSAVARTNMTQAMLNTIVADVRARFRNVARQTIAEYLSAFLRLYVIEEIPQWFPELRDKLRLRKAPKRMLADPSIAVAALRANSNDLARDPRTLGGIFENLCIRDLLVYSDVIGAKLSHYHDETNLEVDAIIEQGTKWAGIEIKMGAHRVDEGAATLTRLRNKVVSKGAVDPAFLCVVTGGGPLYTREDGIHVIPIDCFKPL